MARTLRSLLVAGVVLALVAPVAEGSRKRARAAQECAHEDIAPAPGNLDDVRDAILCLHNRIRAQHDLPALRDNRRLRRAAAGHSEHMVADGFFAHDAPSGATMVDRIMDAGYVRRDDGWALGENLAWGTGSFGTPRGAVEAWMDSPGHRENILRRSYRELGVGVVLGVPVSGADGATYTVDFGVRR